MMAKAKQKAAPGQEASSGAVAGDELLGPVALCLAKRLRACRKKLRKIEDVEAAVSAGKEINEEQRSLLSEGRKAGLIAVIDELEKLSGPVKEALTEVCICMILAWRLRSLQHMHSTQAVCLLGTPGCCCPVFPSCHDTTTLDPFVC